MSYRTLPPGPPPRYDTAQQEGNIGYFDLQEPRSTRRGNQQLPSIQNLAGPASKPCSPGYMSPGLHHLNSFEHNPFPGPSNSSEGASPVEEQSRAGPSSLSMIPLESQLAAREKANNGASDFVKKLYKCVLVSSCIAQELQY